MKCPYCLSELNHYKVLNTQSNTQNFQCDECDNEISAIVLHDLKSNPCFTLGMVGFSNHGKTVYITSLFYMLKIFMNDELWPGLNMLALDQKSINMVSKRIDALLQGQLPDATPENFPEPCLIRFSNLPVAETVSTYIYDIGGEVYSDLDVIQEKAELIAKSDTLLFMISIKELERWQEDIYPILNTYIVYAGNKLGIGTHQLSRRQNLIVVFTKADEIIQDLPSDIKQSLLEGTYAKYKNIDYALLEKLRSNSKIIEDWLINKKAAGFVNLARSSFKSVHYTMVSSLGQKPQKDNRLAGSIQPTDPKNVLDPFVMALGNHVEFPGQPRKSFWKWVRNFLFE